MNLCNKVAKMDKLNLLKNKKLRVTDFRLMVLAIFDQFDNAISLEQIEANLGDFDRITLYRTLRTFKNKGVIHEITLPNDEKKMALCSNDCSEKSHTHNHLHFKCTSCDEVFCLDVQQFPKIDLEGFKIDALEIQAVGICNTCI